MHEAELPTRKIRDAARDIHNELEPNKHTHQLWLIFCDAADELDKRFGVG